MKKALLLFLLVSFSVKAQFSFVSSNPADGSVNVSVNDTLSFTFSEPIDTMSSFNFGDQYFTNVYPPFQKWFSQDLTTVYFAVNLDSAKYYWFLFHGVKSADGEKMQQPALVRFTTDSVFSGYSVSGNVSIEDTSVAPENSLVAFLGSPLGNGDPMILFASYADSNGDYTVEHMPNGVYYPVAVKDVNENGEIDPGEGDFISQIDSIFVDGADLSGVDFVLGEMEMVDFSRAKALIDSLRNNFPQAWVLYFVQGWNLDSLAGASEWEFYFLNLTMFQAYRVHISPFGHDVEQLPMDFFTWLRDFRALADSFNVAAPPDSFIHKVERRVGRFLRNRQLPDSIGFDVSLALGDLSHTDFSDVVPEQGKFYWGLRYSFYNKYDTSNGGGIPYAKGLTSKLAKTENEEYKFLADYKTGNEVSVTSVNDKGSIIKTFELKQNYPNPFNPTTVINYTIPEAGLVSLKVYDVLGNEVADLVNQKQASGEYRVSFNASRLASGIYFYRLQAGKYTQVRKMMLLK